MVRPPACQRDPHGPPEAGSVGGEAAATTASPGRMHSNKMTPGGRITVIRSAPAVSPPMWAHHAVSPLSSLTMFQTCTRIQKPSTQAEPSRSGIAPNARIMTFAQGRSIRYAATTPAIARNNIFHGNGTVSTQAGAVLDHNYTGSAALFVDAAHYDYRLLPTASAVIDAGIAPGTGAGESLQATRVYVHPTASAPRFVVNAVDIGAYEWPDDAIFVNGFDG